MNQNLKKFSIIEKEKLSETVRSFPVLYDKPDKVNKECSLLILVTRVERIWKCTYKFW